MPALDSGQATIGGILEVKLGASMTKRGIDRSKRLRPLVQVVSRRVV
jgi:hypothetical protein